MMADAGRKDTTESTERGEAPSLWPGIDEIDWAFAERYLLAEEELDFIINCDIKYRMGLDKLRGKGEMMPTVDQKPGVLYQCWNGSTGFQRILGITPKGRSNPIEPMMITEVSG